MPGRKVYRLNFGYRSLIDWQGTKGFSRANMRSGGGFAQGRSGIAGPTRFTSGSGRPPLSQSTSSKVPGGRMSQGIYYGVRNFNTPPLRSTKGEKVTRDEILANLDKYNQQWLYLAAEKMKKNLFDMRADDSISEEAYSNLEKLLQSEEPGMKRMAQAMATKSISKDMHQYGPQMIKSITSKTTQWNKMTKKDFTSLGENRSFKTYTPDKNLLREYLDHVMSNVFSKRDQKKYHVLYERVKADQPSLIEILSA